MAAAAPAHTAFGCGGVLHYLESEGKAAVRFPHVAGMGAVLRTAGLLPGGVGGRSGAEEKEGRLACISIWGSPQ